MDMEIPGAPRPEDAARYAQRMREVKEISRGQRPRGKQRRASGRLCRESERVEGGGRREVPRRSTDSSIQSVQSGNRSAFAKPERVERGEAEWSGERHTASEDGSANDGECGSCGERFEYGDQQRARHGGSKGAMRGDRRVRPPQRRTRASRGADSTARKVSTLAVVGVSAVTSALVSMGTAAMTSVPGGALSGFLSNGWWM